VHGFKKISAVVPFFASKKIKAEKKSERGKPKRAGSKKKQKSISQRGKENQNDKQKVNASANNFKVVARSPRDEL